MACKKKNKKYKLFFLFLFTIISVIGFLHANKENVFFTNLLFSKANFDSIFTSDSNDKAKDAIILIEKENMTQNLVEDTTMKPLFEKQPISEQIQKRIYGKSYKENCTIPYKELRYLTISYYGFDGEIHQGELIVNKKIADDMLSIMKELFDAQYPIEQMILIDEYEADDIISMEKNNSSAFNYRYIDGTTVLSNHSRGFAIDINPLYNPYIHNNGGILTVLPQSSQQYVDRSYPSPYIIDKNDTCYKIFTKYGFDWGGDWETTKDYQHFEKIIE